VRDSDGNMRFEVLASGSDSVLMRVTPAIPRTLHRALDELEPFGVVGSIRRRR